MSRRPFGEGAGTPPLDVPEKSVLEPFYVTSSTSRPGGNRQRSSSPGILGRIGLAQPSLHISLVEDVFFLHPEPDGRPSDDEFVRGNVRLWLPKPRTLKHLTVRLIGRYDIGWNDSTPYESGVCLERTVSLLSDGEELQLEKGEHTFEFIIIVPASTACYERCQYGRVRHVITAKAKGIGPMGGDILSNEKPVFLIVNPGLDDVSRPPPPMHLKFEGSLEEIGPYVMSLQSEFSMVGGLLLFRLNLLFPPVDIFIYSIKVKIIQTFHLQSPVDKNHATDPTPHSQTVFILDSAHPPNYGKVSDEGRGGKSGTQTPRMGPLKALRKDEMWKVHHLARIPNDNHLRPSTQEGTVTPISVSHSIHCEITYRPMTEDEVGTFDPAQAGKKGKEKEKEPERRKIVMAKPLDLFSCCCFLDSLTLPVYSLLDPNPMPLDAELQLPCVCGMSTRRLIEKHAKHLMLDDDSDATIEYISQPKPESNPMSPVSPTTPTDALSQLALGESSLTDEPQPLTPTEDERGRPMARRVSPASSRAASTSGFFRVGSSSDRLFAMTGWRAPSLSASVSASASREGSRAASRANSRAQSRANSQTRS
ncbi:hypothetical protein NBRC10512_003678 [Rhodotorula toruloides]|uniref:RHTO0S13e02828g1_1 n=2 Tax=Rhodotorula toruloides TaxID=5286 RepID=A0A061BIR8_RHOTO|nr:Immunoglobulin E-set domain protein [Rhodotorula toruloides NP11]EMS22466.1 Immunoglobulin E-set domain protein [Rhodotorula toruloides NP11]KAJ8295141.1 hypothetical protein OF846_002173 [Rhodotorula toruloides]CDR46876.1 RHTO0S13e02828g1_1 [Rhodotorula toruloides]